METKNVTLTFSHKESDLDLAIKINGKTISSLLEESGEEKLHKYAEDFSTQMKKKEKLNIKTIVEWLIQNETTETSDELIISTIAVGIVMEGNKFIDTLAIQKLIIPCITEKLSVSQAVEKFKKDIFTTLQSSEKDLTIEEIELQVDITVLLLLTVIQMIMYNKDKLQKIILTYIMSAMR